MLFPVSNYWNTFNQPETLAARSIFANQKAKKESRDQKQYRQMHCGFELFHRSPEEKQFQLNYWRHQGLPAYCSMVGASKAWMEAERKLLEECAKTCGPAEVHYMGPELNNATSLMRLQESSNDGKATTAERRETMGARLKKHRWTQTRHALAMKEPGGPVTPALLVALDHLLERYDEGLRRRGFKPSDLRSRLRQHNVRQQRNPGEPGGNGLAQKMRSTASYPEVPDIEVSPEERVAFCREMRAEMSNEKTMLDLMTGEALPVEAQEEVWESTCREIVERYSEADLNQLLKVLRQLLPSLSGWGHDKTPAGQTTEQPRLRHAGERQPTEEESEGCSSAYLPAARAVSECSDGWHMCG